MVVFDCNGCGEALKKNQVQKHRMICRNSQKLSCIDCGNDFFEQEYEKHIKCITEEEKYSGKNYKPKANANKGEQKQELWTEQVQAAIVKVKLNYKLKEILTKLQDYPNIPRKKAKFINFMTNSMKVFNQKLASEAWEAISAEININKHVETVNIEANNDISKEEDCLKETLMDTNLSETGSNKKKRKRDDSLTNNKRSINNLTNDKDNSIELKKFKISSNEQKNINCNNVNNNSNHNIDELNTNKKKKKQKNQYIPTTNYHSDVNSGNEVSKILNSTKIEDKKNSINGSPRKIKFNFKNAIKDTLMKASNKQMTIRKLKKTIYKDYLKSSNGQSLINKEKFMKKIDIKLTKITNINLSEELVTLK